MAARMRDGDAENIPEEEVDEDTQASSSRRRTGGGGPSQAHGDAKEADRRRQVGLRTKLRGLQAKTAGEQSAIPEIDIAIGRAELTYLPLTCVTPRLAPTEQVQAGDGTTADLQDNLVESNKMFNESKSPLPVVPR